MGCREAQLWCVLIPLVALGCSDSPRAADDVVEISQYSRLPGLAATHNQALREELARLRSERATPDLLARRVHQRGVTLPGNPRFNGVIAIEQALPENIRPSFLADVQRVYPQHRFEFDQRRLQRASEIRANYRPQLFALQQLVKRSDLEFSWDPTQGLGDELPFIELAHAGNRMMALVVADLIEHGRLSEAVDSLIPLFRMAQALGEVRHLVPRIAAVHMRREILEIARAICQHSNVDREIQRQLQQQLTAQVAQLPPDGDAWIGDRAAGLHLYELIRDGYLLSVLTYDELKKFRDEVGIEQLGELVAKNLDNDELFYLETMRKTIEACQQPFYQRLSQLHEIKRNLENLRQGSDYPFVADHFLLKELVVGQRLQALDRARLEAWQLALRSAIDGQADSTTNPMTGHPFILDIQPDRVIVDGIDPTSGESAVQIPVLGQSSPDSVSP